jgi:phosphomannomutase
MVQAAVTAGLLSVGCEVLDLGICPTPTLQLAVTWLGARGGVSITGGHNPPEWNALKFVRGDGLYLSAIQGEELLDVFHQGAVERASWDRLGTRVEEKDAIPHHLAAILPRFDAAAIRARRLRVAVDCGNGSCSRLVPRWLAELGCEVLPINDDLSLPFPRLPEPSVAAAGQARAIVLAGKADLGLVLDADGERLSLVDETGRPLSEELTLPLAAVAALARRTGTIVTNVSTTGLVEKVAARLGAKVIRTPVGQAFISRRSSSIAPSSGRGQRRVAVPEVHAITTARRLTARAPAARGGRSPLVADLPAVAMRKLALPVAPRLLFSALQEFREAVGEVEGATVDQTDGVKIAWPDGWVHVRASNTQSLLRVIAEADDAARAQELADWARERVRV